MAHRTIYSSIYRLVLFLSFSCLSHKAYSQLNLKDSMTIKALSDSIVHYEFGDPDKALSFVKKKMTFCLAIKSNKHYLNTWAEKMGVHLSSNRLIDLAKDFEEFDIEFKRFNIPFRRDAFGNEIAVTASGARQEGGNYDDLLKQVNNIKSIYYFQIADYTKVKEYIANQLSPFQNKKILANNDYFTINRFKQQSAEVNLRIGNYQAAINDVESGLDALYKTNKKIPINIEMDAFEKLAAIYLKIKQFDKAEYYFNKKLENFEILKKDKNSYLDLLNNYLSASNFYFTIDKVDKSLFYLNKLENLANKNDDYLNKVYTQRALISVKSNKLPEALLYYDKALNLSLKTLGNKHFQVSQIYLEMARLYQKQNNFTQSLECTQAALIAFFTKFESRDWRNNPSVSDVFSKKDLLETLDFKAGLLLELAKKQPEYLVAAYNAAQLAAGLIDNIRADYTSDFDKQYLAEWSYGVYEKAINSAYLLYEKTKDAQYINTAFNALERSKSIVLLEALKSGKAEAALSDDDRENLYLLKAQLQKLEKQIYDETTQNKKSPDDPSVKDLQNRLIDTRRQYEALVKSFETLYPDYYKVKYNPTFAQLKEVQQRLPKDGSAIILEYFVGDHDIYTFLISRNACKIFKKEKPKDIEQRIEMLRQAVIHDNPQSSTQFINQATWFYNLVLSTPLSNLLHSKVKKLIIIPDGILSYVPFEMLFDGTGLDKHKWSDMPFLINQYAISYANSGNLLNQQMQPKEQKARNLFAGFAAQYKPNDAPLMASRAALTRDNAYDLPNALKEVEAIQAMIGGMLYTKAQSNEHNFKIFANQYRIIHCAMHAVPDSLNPMLSKLLFTYNSLDTLEDNDLTAAELYTMRLNADMAILSACQTGYGIINRGEGVMSLSRAFAYAGVPATIMSLWKVPDNTTSEIMIEFYKNLKKRQPKDEALRNAKLHYLKHHEAEEDLQNPFYWAGFVAVGNMKPIDMTPPYQNFIIGSLILLAFVGLVYALRQRQNRAL